MPDSTAPPTELLSGRYRLQSEIARGGMAAVWRAHDETLGRDVAVKLLHPHLATDPAFLDRFRREARAAAALNHPNVVSVFDWGEDDAGAYLVMELIDGPSLRDVLRIRGRLQPGEALSLLAPVADALGAAHEAGLVHRDVKPENVLLASTGTVKVTDFGLARAVASSRQTFGSDVIVGSPHYLPPEAVTGGALGVEADVYSLGVVLYECLTGHPPYQGETPMATALQHTTSQVPAPSTVVPGLPHALDAVVARATATGPGDRYRDMRELASAMDLATPGGPVTVDLRDGAHHTVVLPTDATDTIVRARESAAAASPGRVGRRRREPRKRRGRHSVTLLVTLTLLAAAGAAAWAFLLAPVTAIPSIAGLTEADARTQLEEAGFEATVIGTEHSLEVAEGRIERYEPAESARKGATIGLVLSDGPRQIEIPLLAGEPRDDAIAALSSLGLEPVVSEAYSEDVAEGLVLTTDPAAGEIVDEASEIDVQVSIGRRPIEIPDVRTKDAEAALAQLSDLGLEPVVIEDVFSDDVPEGHVVWQDVEPGQTRFRGDQIQLRVSKGARTFPMPDVIGEEEAEARRILESVGLVVEVERVGSFLRPKGEVARTDPDPDQQVRRGQTVTIFVWD